MPRPTRAQGRPGTKVIPGQWGPSHAPVALKTFTAKCRILPAKAGPLVFNETKRVSERTGGEPLYDAGCRLQALANQPNVAAVGEQSQTTSEYLVAIDYAAEVGINDLVEIYECDDAAIVVPLRLRIRSGVEGSLRFERDLFCTLDQSGLPTPAPTPPEE